MGALNNDWRRRGLAPDICRRGFHVLGEAERGTRPHEAGPEGAGKLPQSAGVTQSAFRSQSAVVGCRRSRLDQ
jgi:hypothetical protein